MNILETIIRGVLTEAPASKAKLRSADQTDLQAVRSEFGSESFAYYTVVKNVGKSETQLMNMVAAATMGSQDSENRVGVGRGSIYANGKFIYVVNTDGDINRKNVVSVWVIPNKLSEYSIKSTNTDIDSKSLDTDMKIQTEPEVKVVNAGLMIGKSLMMTRKAYDNRVNKILKQDPAADIKPIDAMPENTPGMVAAIKDLISPEKQDQTVATTTNAAAETTTSTTSGYPKEIDGVKFYTMSETDPYVYAKIDNVWKYANKKSFEISPRPRYFETMGKPLNQAGISKLEKQFNLTASSETPTDIDTTTITPTKTGLKSGTQLTWTVGTGSRIPVYFYNSSTKKYTQSKQTWEVGSTRAKYQTASSNGKYYYVDLNGTKVWIEKKYFK